MTCQDPGLTLTDGAVVLRQWRLTDTDWYAATVHDAEIQRYTTESPTLTAAEVRAAIVALADQPNAGGFVICEAATGQRLGNIALLFDASVGEVSYWVAASARSRGVATRALRLVSDWAFATVDLAVIRLWTHSENAASHLVAERAGYRRAPDDDQRRTVKGQVRDTVGSLRAAPDLASRHRRATP
jgi:RimJ/RimL family protein N-acetyltransferase